MVTELHLYQFTTLRVYCVANDLNASGSQNYNVEKWLENGNIMILKSLCTQSVDCPLNLGIQINLVIVWQNTNWLIKWLIYCMKINWRTSILLVIFVCFCWLGETARYLSTTTLIPWIEQGGSILLVTLLYDLCVGLTIFMLNGRSDYSGQSYKVAMLVIYESRVVNMSNLLVTTTQES